MKRAFATCVLMLAGFSWSRCHRRPGPRGRTRADARHFGGLDQGPPGSEPTPIGSTFHGLVQAIG